MLLLSVLPFAAGTFFPFTWRPPFSPPRYGYRSQRSPSSNLIPVESPILGLRFLVPRGLFDLFNVRPPGPNYNRPNPFLPPNGFGQNSFPPNGFGSNAFAPNNNHPNNFGPNNNHPNNYAPNNFAPNNFAPNNFAPNNFAPNNLAPNNFAPNNIPAHGYTPNNIPPHNFAPNRLPLDSYLPQAPNHSPPNSFSNGPRIPMDPDTFINLMRVLYPDLIYQPDPSLPNVFAIRPPNAPPSHLPDARPLPHDFYQNPTNLPSPNRQYGELPPNASQYSGQQFSPPRNYQQQSQPQNHLIIIR